MKEEFKQILTEAGIHFREPHSSIALNHCPSCGTKKYKVFFAEDSDGVLYGKCFRGNCQTGYSAQKYLALLGIPQEEIRRRIGVKSFEEIIDVTNSIFSPILLKTMLEAEKEPTAVENDISSFFDISVWPNHPASKYAIERGVTEKAYGLVKIDPDTNAVVFLCLDKDGNCLGFQRRFLKPQLDWQKTKTSSGFKAHDNIIVFPNGSKICVCEGPFTAIAAQNYGFTGICTFGSGINNKQLDKILELAGESDIYVGVDLDEAGESYFDKIQRYCYWKNRKAVRIEPGTGLDLNDSWVAGAKYKIIEAEVTNPAVPKIFI